MIVHVKRVYDPPEPADGRRVLVDRLWPRGLRKDAARIDVWLKDAAPSTSLRTWFGHDPARWPQFKRRYWQELEKATPLLDDLLATAGSGPITLLYAARDRAHNNAVALAEYLQSRRQRRRPAAAARD